MVTVVKSEPHHSVIKEAICRNCGATLAYVPNDIKEEVHRDYGGGSEIYKHIMCPQCNHKVGV